MFYYKETISESCLGNVPLASMALFFFHFQLPTYLVPRVSRLGRERVSFPCVKLIYFRLCGNVLNNTVLQLSVLFIPILRMPCFPQHLAIKLVHFSTTTKSIELLLNVIIVFHLIQVYL